jgi:hypothetical protein
MMVPTQGSPTKLTPKHTPGAQIKEIAPATWRLEIPAGTAGVYRLAQLDDYSSLRRENFLWQPGAQMALHARASVKDIPGTWGFGLWNDPFSLAFWRGGGTRFPALPNTAWFFFASSSNYLSLRDDIPAHGALAATFHSPPWPPASLALALPVLPFLALPPAARWLRRLGRRCILQDAAQLSIDPSTWHSFKLDWLEDKATFWVDNEVVFNSLVSPHPPLGLVIWIDNQFAAWSPSGRISYGVLANSEPAWIEVTALDNHPTSG